MAGSHDGWLRFPGWDGFWFGSGSLVRLATFRIVMVLISIPASGYAGGILLGHADALDAGREVPWNPLYVLDLLRLHSPSGALARVVLAILALSTLTSLIGFKTRLSTAVLALTSFYWWAVAYSHGQAHHEKISLIFGLMALPLSPSGARLSVDAILSARKAVRSGSDRAVRVRALPPVPMLGEWAMLPLRVVQVSAVLGYFFAGMTKLVQTGPKWANGYSLQATMLGTEGPWSSYFSGDVTLARLMATALLVMQVTFPLIVLHKRLRWIYIPGATAFHLVAWQTMETGIYWTLWIPLIAAFFALDRIPSWFADSRRPRWWRLLVAIPFVVLTLYFTHVYLLNASYWAGIVLLPLLASCVVYFVARGEVIVFYGGEPATLARAALLRGLDWARRIRWVGSEEIDHPWAETTERDPIESLALNGHAFALTSAEAPARYDEDALAAAKSRMPLLWILPWLVRLPRNAGGSNS